MRRFAGWAAAALALAAVAAGCGDRGGSLTGYGPEGIPSQMVLVAQLDESGGVFSDSITVLGRVPTNTVRLFDNADGSGFRPLGDFVLPATRTYSTGWSIYEVRLPNFDPTVNHFLLARGSRDGRENMVSPLSNQAFVPASGGFDHLAPADTLPLRPRAPVPNPDASPLVKVDSLFFHLAVVPQAQHVFLRVAKGKVTDYLVLYERQPDDSFQPATVFENVPPALNQTYNWRLDEYDGNWLLVARTSVPGSFIIQAPKVAGNPFIWPTTSDHYIFHPWSLSGLVAARPPAR